MITAILLAAGKGERAGFGENKVLREYDGLPVLAHALSAFAAEEIGEILVACRAEDEPRINAIIRPYPNARTVPGGDTRADSVFFALKETKGETVLIHDAARPFVTRRMIRDCIESTRRYGSGVPALPAVDTTVLAEDGKIVAALPRAQVYTVQTPQGFRTKELLRAYEQSRQNNEIFTDDSGVYAKYVATPKLYEGDAGNRKLTFAEDFSPAERVGFGADTHAFYTENEGAPFIDFITLGGVRIPSEKILKAHSDGDVLVHALMDALLSAAGLRDIGYYVPDTDARYAGADSMELLAETMRRVKDEGFAPKNASISILAETPRLSPYIERMKQNLANALLLPLSAIGIAAGTNEKLGYVGEKKGITVFATVMLRKTDES